MKKILAVIIAAIMLFSLGACGGNTGNSKNGASDADLVAMLSGIGSSATLYGNMDAATKPAFIAEGAKQGLDISFGADGSTTIVDTSDGTTIIQNPDGTWVIKDEDGGEGQLGGDWPDNEYTKIVPKPDFELTAARVDDEGFVVAFQSATLDQIKDYVTKIKAAGFTLNEELTDENVMGYQMYTFYAENSTGYSVEITSAMGTTGMTISKIN